MKDEVSRCLASWEGSAGRVRAVFRFPPDLPVFAGHFPGFPLVPGVFLLETVRLAAERATGKELRIAAVSEAKFTAPVGPGDTVEADVVLAAGAPGWIARSSLAAGGKDVARIALRLVEEDAPAPAQSRP